MDIADKQKLVLDNMRLAYKIAREFNTVAGNRENVVSDALCGLVEAADRFDISRGTAFSTFAVKTIRGLIKNGLARRRKERFLFSLESELSEGAGYYEAMDYRSKCGFSQDTLDQLESLLCDREFKLISEYFILGKTFQEIGCESGISRSRISQIYRKAINKLRKIIDGNEEAHDCHFLKRKKKCR